MLFLCPLARYRNFRREDSLMVRPPVVLRFIGFYTIHPGRPRFPPLLALVFSMGFHGFNWGFMVFDTGLWSSKGFVGLNRAPGRASGQCFFRGVRPGRACALRFRFWLPPPLRCGA